MLWIVGAYFLLTVGEVLVYGTMLDLSYAYAPASMKGFITACFLLTNTMGNLINTQYGKFYFSGLGKEETLVQKLEWGAQVATPAGSTMFRFYPQVFFSIDAAIAVTAAVGFFFVARRFNRGARAAQ
jgi:dipeptide/tripeptide permease